MNKDYCDVTEAELRVLEALWENGASSRKEVMTRLYPRATESDRATVQKLLERLEQKGYVSRDRSARVHVFQATVDRDKLIGERLRSLADRMCGGSLTPLLTHLICARGVNTHDREDLHQWIDELLCKKER